MAVASLLPDLRPPEKCLKEGGCTPEEFREAWRRINGGWDLDELVVVYEFKVVETPEPRHLNGCMEKKEMR